MPHPANPNPESRDARRGRPKQPVRAAVPTLARKPEVPAAPVAPLVPAPVVRRDRSVPTIVWSAIAATAIVGAGVIVALVMSRGPAEPETALSVPAEPAPAPVREIVPLPPMLSTPPAPAPSAAPIRSPQADAGPYVPTLFPPGGSSSAAPRVPGSTGDRSAVAANAGTDRQAAPSDVAAKTSVPTTQPVAAAPITPPVSSKEPETAPLLADVAARSPVAVFDVTDSARLRTLAAEGWDRTIAVDGVVASWTPSSTGKVLRVEFKSAGPDGLFVAIFPRDRMFQRMGQTFGGTNGETLVGQRIRVRGKLELYEGRPEIVVNDPAQIEVLDANGK